MVVRKRTWLGLRNAPNEVKSLAEFKPLDDVRRRTGLAGKAPESRYSLVAMNSTILDSACMRCTSLVISGLSALAVGRRRL